jgi:LuxR family maltose regulon positive regulatory protein
MFDLVWSKLRRPLARPGLIRRDALLGKLDHDDTSAVVSVRAPAGYGKSTLLSQWAASNSQAIAWVSVDEKDNDPKLLLSGVAKALDAIEPVGSRVFDALASPASSVSGSAVPRLGSALASMSTPVLLILDDVHLLRDTECRAAVAALADHVPKGSRLVLAGQDEPPLPLARLRAEGRILQLGLADLSLTREEAARLLRAAGLTPGQDEVADLHRRTGGWPALLYLTALAAEAGGTRLSETGGRSDVSRGQDGSSALEHVAAEYLSRIAPDQREFLIRTSVLDRMCGPLCQEVLTSPVAAAALADLAAANLLVVPLDRLGRWYRYHPLFRALLLAELDRAEPGQAPALRRRAAGWCRDHGLPEEAVEYAMAAGDVGEVASLVAELSQPGERDDRTAMLRRWYRWLDEHGGMDRDPVVAVWAAFLALETGQARDAGRWAAAADRQPAAGKQAISGWAALLRAVMCRHGVGPMRADADESAQALGDAGITAPATAFAQALARAAGGDTEGAGAYLKGAVRAAKDTGVPSVLVMALGQQTLLALARGDWGDGQALAEQASLVLREAGLEDSMAAPLLFALQARMALHRLDPDGARRALVSAQRRRHLLNHAVPYLAVQVRIELTRSYLDLADLAGAGTLLRETGELLSRCPDLGPLAAETQALRNRLAAERAAQSAEPDAGTPERHVVAAGPSALTAAELRLLPLLSAHLSTPEIAAELGRPAGTVRSQATSIYRKLGAAGRSQAVARARELGLLDR